MFLGDNYRGFLCLKYSQKRGQHVGKCTKIIKNEPNQVHMAPFGPKLAQNPSQRLWEGSGMPPGPQNHPRGPRGAQGGPRGPMGAAPPYPPISLWRCGVALKGLLH